MQYLGRGKVSNVLAAVLLLVQKCTGTLQKSELSHALCKRFAWSVPVNDGLCFSVSTRAGDRKAVSRRDGCVLVFHDYWFKATQIYYLMILRSQKCETDLGLDWSQDVDLADFLSGVGRIVLFSLWSPRSSLNPPHMLRANRFHFLTSSFHSLCSITSPVLFVIGLSD